ncbi:MAG TPA: DNA polymerase [Candidatus Paceibacterota bacterium]|nr:DNA polymerase [Candidatus Paceibacterota bacterium]
MAAKTEKKTKTLVLLDAHAIIHRAYHALPEFSSSRGEPTGALYGLSNMLMKIISELKPDYIAACYDLPGKTFRHEAYEKYKAGRAKADEALVAQLQSSRKIFEAFDIPIYDSPGFEADDILGTISEELKKEKNVNIIIASGDMDTMQLVHGEKVRVFTLKKGLNDTIMYDQKAVEERFGFPPELLPDYKGLRGDPSDNIIGIKGIGEKTAATLISKFGTIEEIYKKLKKDDKPFIAAGLSPRVIQLIKDNEEEALFSKTLAKIRRDAPVDFKLPNQTFWQKADLSKIEKTFSEFEFRSLLSRIRGFFGKNGGSIPEPAEQQTLMPEDAPGELELEETSIALWLLNSEIPNPGLQDILDYARVRSFPKAREYIFKKLKEEKLDLVYEEIEKPIMPVVREMSRWGILIDRKYFAELSREYNKELGAITRRIYKMAGTEFNLNSPKQLGEVLFVKLGIKSGHKKSASGALSTKISVLEELEEGNPIITEIIKYRELQKLVSTYVEVIPKMAGSDGRLHAKFLQAGAATGRFSSQDPNLQNLPIKSELGRRIRAGFIAAPGHKLAAFDYSQIELRIGAMLSGDKNMTEIFRERKDIHAGVAARVFSVPIDKVDAEMRRRAKVINFGIIYGMGVNALRKNIGGTREEAQKFYDNYFRQFSGIRDYLEEVKAYAAAHKYTETLFGRRRSFQNIRSKIPFIRNMAERTAINAPIQGTAADVIKLAIRYADEDLRKAGLGDKVHLVLQVHDELVYEIEDNVLKKAEGIIKDAMETVLSRSYIHFKTEIPILVHYGAGANLGQVK